MPQYLRLQTALDLHSKLYPTCLTVWRGEPCDQQEARPQPKTTVSLQPSPTVAYTLLHSLPSLLHHLSQEGPASLQESHTHSPDACQLWVACADFHTSSLIVWDFSDGHFTAVQVHTLPACAPFHFLILSSHSAVDISLSSPSLPPLPFPPLPPLPPLPSPPLPPPLPLPLAGHQWGCQYCAVCADSAGLGVGGV